MTDALATITAVLAELRPEAALDAIPPDADLREELDLDSMDVLNLVIALSDATGIDIPEEDYRHLATLDDAVAYLDAHGA
jgi:acyl carrier protein